MSAAEHGCVGDTRWSLSLPRHRRGRLWLVVGGNGRARRETRRSADYARAGAAAATNAMTIGGRSMVYQLLTRVVLMFACARFCSECGKFELYYYHCDCV